MSLLENGRIATALLTHTGTHYLHPYAAVGDSVVERAGHLDAYGRHIFVPHTDVEFYSVEETGERGEFTYELAHGELLKILMVGGATAYFDNLDQPLPGGDGTWDLFHPAGVAGEEHIIVPGLFINPVDGDISAGNLMLHVY